MQEPVEVTNTAPQTTQQPDQSAAQSSAIFEEVGMLENIGVPFDFDNPWGLPAGALGMLMLWMVLRSITLKHEEQEFAPLFILEEIQNTKSSKEQMKWLEKMPWMLAGAFATAVASGMTWNDMSESMPQGDVIIAFDGDWPMSSKWDQTYRPQIQELLQQAYTNDADICFLNMVGDENGGAPYVTEPMSAELAYSYIENFSPLPWASNREAAQDALENLKCDGIGSTYWMTNGLQTPGALDFAMALHNIAPLTVYNETDRATLMMVPKSDDNKYRITLKRADIAPEEMKVSAYTQSYKLIGTIDASFEEAQTETTITFDPAEFGANTDAVYRFKIDEENAAGATILLSNEHKPRSVGIASIAGNAGSGSYVSEEYFLGKALEGTTKIYTSGLEELIDGDKISVLVVPDATPVSDSVRDKLQRWLEDGGTLVRFAGPNMAAQEHRNDPLLPVNLQSGSVNYGEGIAASGGVMVQDSFEKESMFSYLDIEGEVPIFRTANIESTLPDDAKVEARLSNGQPFVISAKRGAGKVILFPVPATPVAWSDFPITEAFYDMLVKAIDQANSIESTLHYDMPELTPITVLDGKGEPAAPPPNVAPLTQDVLNNEILNAEHRAGIYGTKLQKIAYNLSESIPSVEPMDTLPQVVTMAEYRDMQEDDKLRDYLLTATIAMMAVGMAVLGMPRRNKDMGASTKRGLWRRKREADQPSSLDV